MRKKLLVVAGGAVALLAHAGVVHALLHGGSVLGAFVAIAIGAIAIGGAVGFLTRKPALVGVSVLCAFLGSFFTAYFLDGVRDLEAQLVASNVVRDVAPAALHEQPPGRVVYLQDCDVDAERKGVTYRDRRRGGTDAFLVAPIVPPGWTPDQPVVAWAAFRTNDSLIGGYTEAEGLAEWAKPNRAGFVLEPDARYADAIAAAESRHGVRSAPGAPLLAWRSPEEKRSDGWRRVLYAVLATQGAWLLGALGWVRARA